MSKRNYISFTTTVYHVDKNMLLNDKIISNNGYARKKILKDKVENFTHDKYDLITHTSKSSYKTPLIWCKSCGYWTLDGFKKTQSAWYQQMKKFNVQRCTKY